MNPHEELWSKQSGLDHTYPLLAHLLDAATAAGVLYDRWLRRGLQDLFHEALGDDAKRAVQYAVGAHDIGKANPAFQFQFAQRASFPSSTDPWPAIRERISSTHLYSPIGEYAKFRDTEQRFIRRHEHWSARFLATSDLEATDPVSSDWLSVTAAGHHGLFDFYSEISPPRLANADRELATTGWIAAQRDLAEDVRAALDLRADQIPEELPPVQTLLLSGFVVLADRIASTSEFVESGEELLRTQPDLLSHPREWCAAREEDALQRIQETVGIYEPWSSADEARRAILGDFEPRAIQQEALHTGDGLWSLMASTGGGKTEAALLRHSLRPERLLFLLPTQATSNAIMTRVQRAFAGTSNVAALAHGLASVEDFYSQPVTVTAEASTHLPKDDDQKPRGLFPTEFVRSGAARLFAPVCVGTVDQALMGALPGKWLHFRLLALANSHIVVDEVHTLDQYQTKLLEAIMPWLRATNTRVTFLTATMPSWQRKTLARAYGGHSVDIPPAHFPATETVTPGSLTSREVHTRQRAIALNLQQSGYDELVATHLAWYRAARQKYPRARIGIICNTVKRAQDVAESIRQHGDEPVILMHSRMTALHRREQAAALLAGVGPRGTAEAITVVGTQAIEASLDIDLDLLDTELCPAPSLVQRLGRQWRREDPKRQERLPGLLDQAATVTWVGTTAETQWQVKPYLAAELNRTRAWIAEHAELRIPTDAQEFIDSSTVDFENATDTPEDDEALFETMQRARQAVNRAAAIKDALGDDAWLEDFAALTKGLEADERQTRLVDDSIQFRLILGGDPARVPGAWRGSAEDLMRIHSTDTSALREALLGSLSVRLPKKAQTALLEAGFESLAESHSLLAGYYFLPGAERFYDVSFGFKLPEAK